MSMIAVAMMVLSGSASALAPTTAEQALAAHRAATSIGPDPCRVATGDEIVVCGRRESPYALPLYDRTADDDASKAGGNRVGQMAAIGESQSACAQQRAQCLPPPFVDFFVVAPVIIKSVKALLDDE